MANTLLLEKEHTFTFEKKIIFILRENYTVHAHSYVLYKKVLSLVDDLD